MRRGEKLRCTSCHTGDPAGESHFSTSANTCYICHFKGAEAGRSVTACTTCHANPPEQVSHSGFSFNHSSYLKLGVSCEECHVQIVSGTADVDRSRCNDCHVERMEKFDDFAVMHDAHVTAEGIGCFRCHGEIEHRSLKFVGTLEVGCQNCHSELHAPQKQMYMGVGGRGLADVPSRMFAAKVSCEGCHVEPPATGGAKKTDLQIRRESCVRCHEKGYDAMLDDWLQQVKSALDYVTPMEQRGRQILERLDPANPKVAEVAEFLRDGLANIDLVRQGHGVHNVEYAIKLVNTAADQLQFAFRKYGEPLRFGGKPPVLSEPDGYCGALCHDRLATHKVAFFEEMEIDFDHDSHSHVACTTCHSAQKHKERVIDKDGCMGCHHTDEAQEAYGVGCEDCHGPGSKHITSKDKIATIVRPEELDPKKQAMVCGQCHSRGRTKDGKYAFPHGYLPGMDLSEVFVDAKPDTPAQNQQFSDLMQSPKHWENGIVCESCHDPHGDTAERFQLKMPINDTCLQCHKDDVQSIEAHVQAKGKTMRPGITCATCHMPNGRHLFDRTMADTAQ